MANIVRNVAPFINVTFWVTQEFGASTGTGTHHGVDIATATLSSLMDRRIYSISDGVVLYRGYQQNGFGNYIIIKNNDDTAFLYAHLDSIQHLSVGDSVTRGEWIATEGTTGLHTGLHLHLEYQQLVNGQWNYSTDLRDYLNPCDYMGIDNIDGTSWIYNGYVPPIPPTPSDIRKNRFKWILYANEILERNESQQN